MFRIEHLVVTNFGSSNGQSDTKSRSHPRLTFTTDGATVRDHDFMNDRQAQSRAAAATLSGHAEEFFKDPGHVFGSDACARVADRENHVVLNDFSRQLDPPAGV